MNKGKKKTKVIFPIDRAVHLLRREVKKYKVPIVGHYASSPFMVLISTLLSLRTKDNTTMDACRRLFAEADTPQKILSLSQKRIEELIFPVGFYKVKAKTLHHVCGELIDTCGAQVPQELDRLLAIKGIGRKTANLVVTIGFNLPGICVDTHVHRISNRWGFLKTRTPEETEMTLRKILPGQYWIEYNDLLVTWGQNVCHPVSPRCSGCVLAEFCSKVGVKRHR